MPSVAATAQPFVCAGAAACTASAVVHPIDLAKVRIQLYSVANPGKSSPGFVGMLSAMVKNEGVGSIYAGVGASLMRQAVYGTARIGLHRSFSETLQARNHGQPLSFATKTLTGMCSGAIAVFFGSPFDVTLVRMQADSMKPAAQRRNYKGVLDALIRVVREEGAGKLYSGIAPNVLRGMANNAGMMACFDQAKEIFGDHVFHDPKGKPPSQQTQIAASFVAGFTASFCALPFDLLKSRMQDGSRYAGVADAFVTIARTEGPFAFWQGFSAYYLRTAPHAMIILVTMGHFQELYKSAAGLK